MGGAELNQNQAGVSHNVPKYMQPTLTSYKKDSSYKNLAAISRKQQGKPYRGEGDGGPVHTLLSLSASEGTCTEGDCSDVQGNGQGAWV
jgi:hypothetical protein